MGRGRGHGDACTGRAHVRRLDRSDPRRVRCHCLQFLLHWELTWRRLCSDAAKGLRKECEKDPVHLDLATDVIKALFSTEYDSKTGSFTFSVLCGC